MNVTTGGTTLGDSEERLREFGFAGFWSGDFVTGALTTSPGLADLCGLAGRNSTLQDFKSRLHPDDVGRVTEGRGAIVGPDGTGVMVYRVIDGNGVVRRLLCRALYEKNAAGELVSGRGIVFDITAGGEADEAITIPDLSPVDRIADLLIEAHGLTRLVGDPVLRGALALGLIAVGRSLSSDLLDEAGGLAH